MSSLDLPRAGLPKLFLRELALGEGHDNIPDRPSPVANPGEYELVYVF